MRMQTVMTSVTTILTVMFITLGRQPHPLEHGVGATIPGSGAEVNDAPCEIVVVNRGQGLGSVNAAAAARGTCRAARASRAVIGLDSSFGVPRSMAPIFLLVFGLLLKGLRHRELSNHDRDDPISALTTLAAHLVP